MKDIKMIKSKIIEYGSKAVISAYLPIAYTICMGRNPESYAWSLLALGCAEVIYREYKREKKNLEEIFK